MAFVHVSPSGSCLLSSWFRFLPDAGGAGGAGVAAALAAPAAAEPGQRTTTESSEEIDPTTSDNNNTQTATTMKKTTTNYSLDDGKVDDDDNDEDEDEDYDENNIRRRIPPTRRRWRGESSGDSGIGSGDGRDRAGREGGGGFDGPFGEEMNGGRSEIERLDPVASPVRAVAERRCGKDFRVNTGIGTDLAAPTLVQCKEQNDNHEASHFVSARTARPRCRTPDTNSRGTHLDDDSRFDRIAHSFSSTKTSRTPADESPTRSCPSRRRAGLESASLSVPGGESDKEDSDKRCADRVVSWTGPIPEPLSRCRRFSASTCQALKLAVSCLYRLDDFHVERLASGFFSHVFKVRHKMTGSLAVLKMNADPQNRANSLKEIQLLKRLDHPHILRFVGVCVHEGQLHALTEFAEGGSLESLLKDLSGHPQLSWTLRTKLAADIAEGMKYLHSRGVFHRDLTSKNCLLRKCGSDSYIALVGDFGLATKIPSKDSRKKLSIVGSPYWIAPECLRGDDYDERADVFSFGIIQCEIIGRIEADPDILPRTKNFGLDYIAFGETFAVEAPPQLVQIAFKCCHMDPRRRPTFARLAALLAEVKKALEASVEPEDSLLTLVGTEEGNVENGVTERKWLEDETEEEEEAKEKVEEEWTTKTLNSSSETKSASPSPSPFIPIESPVRSQVNSGDENDAAANSPTPERPPSPSFASPPRLFIPAPSHDVGPSTPRSANAFALSPLAYLARRHDLLPLSPFNIVVDDNTVERRRESDGADACFSEPSTPTLALRSSRCGLATPGARAPLMRSATEGRLLCASSALLISEAMCREDPFYAPFWKDDACDTNSDSICSRRPWHHPAAAASPSNPFIFHPHFRNGRKLLGSASYRDPSLELLSPGAPMTPPATPAVVSNGVKTSSSMTGFCPSAEAALSSNGADRVVKATSTKVASDRKCWSAPTSPTLMRRCYEILSTVRELKKWRLKDGDEEEEEEEWEGKGKMRGKRGRRSSTTTTMTTKPGKSHTLPFGHKFSDGIRRESDSESSTSSLTQPDDDDDDEVVELVTNSKVSPIETPGDESENATTDNDTIIRSEAQLLYPATTPQPYSEAPPSAFCANLVASCGEETKSKETEKQKGSARGKSWKGRAKRKLLRIKRI